MFFVTLMVPVVMWKSHDGWRTTTPGAFAALFMEHGEPDWQAAARNPWVFGVSVTSVLLWLIAATGVPAWFAHPKRFSPARQGRAVAWSLYACAPLAWVAPLTILLGIFLWVETTFEWLPHIFYTAAAVVGICLILIVLIPIGWLVLTAIAIGRATGSRRRGVATLLMLPPLWILLASVILVGLLFLVNYVALLIYSLR